MKEKRKKHTNVQTSLARHGEWLELLADEGDGPFYNTTATPSSLHGWTAPLLVDRHEGVHVGGSPEYVGVSLQAVHSDFRDGECRAVCYFHRGSCTALLLRLVWIQLYVLRNFHDFIVFTYLSHNLTIAWI